MKKAILFTFLISMTIINYVNAQTWIWANSAGSTSYFGDYGEHICIDNNGNTYVTGIITMPVCYFQTDTFTINGFNDFFLAKYDSDGNELWVKQFGGYNSITANPIKTEGIGGLFYDPNVNAIYITGAFIESCVFGTFSLNANGSNDGQMFISKFDLNGNCLWAKSAGGSGDDGFGFLTVDTVGSIYVIGALEYGGTVDTISLPAGTILAKFDNAGQCSMAKKILGYYSANARAINLYDSEIFILGVNLVDSFYVDTMLIQTPDYNGFFISRFNTNGSILDVNKYIGGPSAIAWDNGMSMDQNGNRYILGSFQNGYATFNNNLDTIYTSDSTHFFLVKYDIGGNFKWVRQDSASITASGSNIFMDLDSNTYITGGFSGNAHFGSFNLTSYSSQDMFVAKYNSAGTCIGVNTSGEAFGSAIIADESGNCYVTGSFIDTIVFNSTVLTSNGGPDILVAKSDMIMGNEGKTLVNNNKLLIYANPNTGKCNITVPDEFLNDKNLTLKIFDNTGKLIQPSKLEMIEDKIKLNLEQEAKGMYNVILSNGKKNYSGKLFLSNISILKIYTSSNKYEIARNNSLL